MRANLEGANLVDANLEGANLQGANLQGATLADANLEGANLEGATLAGAYVGRANLTGADLAGANLYEASLYEASLEGANLEGADLRGAKFKGANLKGANLKGANLAGVELYGAGLRAANLEGANLEGAFLARADLKGANLRDANLYEANLEGANLEGANLKGANLKGAYLEDADLEGANLEGANLEGAELSFANLRGAYLEGANLEGTILEKPLELHPAVAKGKQTRAISKLQKQALPMKAGAFKKLFPVEFEQIKAETKGADFTPELLQKLVARYGIVWSVSIGRYSGEAQRVCLNDNDVLQLNIDISDQVYSEQQRKNLKAVKQVSARSGHPVARGPNIFTVGWVRYCEFPDQILVEEVQSDVPGVRKGLKDPNFRRRLEEAGVSAEDLEETLSLLAPFADRFYEDALGLIFDMAEEQGKKVEMLDYAQKKQFGSPRDVYSDLPKSMGMKLAPSLALPELGQVWTYTPNRRSRRR